MSFDLTAVWGDEEATEPSKEDVPDVSYGPVSARLTALEETPQSLSLQHEALLNELQHLHAQSQKKDLLFLMGLFVLAAVLINRTDLFHARLQRLERQHMNRAVQ